LNTFSPNTPDLASAGAAIKDSVNTALQREQANAAQDYSAIDKQANGVGVDLRPVKAAAQEILDNSSFTRDVNLSPKTATGVLQKLASGMPDSGSFSDAQQLRSA